MRRYIRSYRTRKNIRQPDALRDQFLTQLTKEAEALFQQLSEKFSQDLQAQASQLFQNMATTANGSSSASGTDGNATNVTSDLSKLVSTGVRYLLSRPRTSRDTQETGRSVDAGAQFRLSQAQAMAEAQQAIGKGDKNA